MYRGKGSLRMDHESGRRGRGILIVDWHDFTRNGVFGNSTVRLNHLFGSLSATTTLRLPLLALIRKTRPVKDEVEMTGVQYKTLETYDYLLSAELSLLLVPLIQNYLYLHWSSPKKQQKENCRCIHSILPKTNISGDRFPFCWRGIYGTGAVTLSTQCVNSW